MLKSPGDGGWSEWGDWTQCDKTCGTGKQDRERTCTNPPPDPQGRDCEGPAEESRSCNLIECRKCSLKALIKCATKPPFHAITPSRDPLLAPLDILKFSLTKEASGNKQSKLNYHIYSTLFFLSSGSR